MRQGLTRLEREQGFSLAAAKANSSDEADPEAETRVAVPEATDDELRLQPLASDPATDATAVFSSSTTRAPRSHPLASRLTRVDEATERGGRGEDGVHASSLQISALAIALLAVVGICWYLWRPDSADQVYDRVSTAAQGSASDLLDAESDIKEFMARFPGDPRLAELQGYQDEIEILRLERRFRARTRNPLGRDSLSTMERDYARASSALERDPEEAVAKLKAFVALYENARPEGKDADADYVSLARRQIASIENQMRTWVPKQLASLQMQLESADGIEDSDPERAAAIRTSIIELYGDTEWAADVVKAADESLRRMPARSLPLAQKETVE
jgi:hypothetical protein